MTLKTADEQGRPHRTCRIEADPRSREEVEAEQARVVAAAEAELDDRALALIARGDVTSVEALRMSLGVGSAVAQAALARLLFAGRVKRPGVKQRPYTVVGGESN